MVNDLQAAFRGRSVFLTGHTGFKGTWLALWLARLGARVSGYALAPDTEPSMFKLAGIESSLVRSTIGDIRDSTTLSDALHAARPELVLHLAAQPLVRRSYREPLLTWDTNVMGTVRLLEAIRECPSVRAVLVVTTDKCYRNEEHEYGYCEGDPLGGNDPYSASKAATELVVHSYRRSHFSSAGGPLLASARAGNVIGGGDWSEDRLIPDAARAVAAHAALRIRHPGATRPWQHVLEALHGYLLLAERLMAGDATFADAFNFGPDASDNRPVADVLEGLRRHWPELTWQVEPVAQDAPHEAHLLHLDSSKARSMLRWSPRWKLDAALGHTAIWYRSVLREPSSARSITEQQLERFCS
jgi:CDP-glucose 4,6-dehydratase